MNPSIAAKGSPFMQSELKTNLRNETFKEIKLVFIWTYGPINYSQEAAIDAVRLKTNMRNETFKKGKLLLIRTYGRFNCSQKSTKRYEIVFTSPF